MDAKVRHLHCKCFKTLAVALLLQRATVNWPSISGNVNFASGQTDIIFAPYGKKRLIALPYRQERASGARSHCRTLDAVKKATAIIFARLLQWPWKCGHLWLSWFFRSQENNTWLTSEVKYFLHVSSAGSPSRVQLKEAFWLQVDWFDPRKLRPVFLSRTSKVKV
jgi:hypothetical protein